MTTEAVFHIAFWILLAGVLVMRLYSNWVFVALAAPSIAGTLARVPREEQMMIDEFQDEYRTYSHRTGRFFPKPGSRAARGQP